MNYFYIKQNPTGNEEGCAFFGNWAVALEKPDGETGFQAIRRYNLSDREVDNPNNYSEFYTWIMPNDSEVGFDYRNGSDFYSIGTNIKSMRPNAPFTTNSYNELDICEWLLDNGGLILKHGKDSKPYSYGRRTYNNTERDWWSFQYYYYHHDYQGVIKHENNNYMYIAVPATEEAEIFVFNDPNKSISQKHIAVSEFIKYRTGAYGNVMSTVDALNQVSTTYGISHMNIEFEYDINLSDSHKETLEFIFWQTAYEPMVTDYNPEWYAIAKQEFLKASNNYGGQIKTLYIKPRYAAAAPIGNDATASDDITIEWGDGRTTSGGINYYNSREKYTHYYPYPGVWMIKISGTGIDLYFRDDNRDVNTPNPISSFQMRSSIYGSINANVRNVEIVSKDITRYTSSPIMSINPAAFEISLNGGNYNGQINNSNTTKFIIDGTETTMYNYGTYGSISLQNLQTFTYYTPNNFNDTAFQILQQSYSRTGANTATGITANIGEFYENYWGTYAIESTLTSTYNWTFVRTYDIDLNSNNIWWSHLTYVQ